MATRPSALLLDEQAYHLTDTVLGAGGFTTATGELVLAKVVDRSGRGSTAHISPSLPPSLPSRKQGGAPSVTDGYARSRGGVQRLCCQAQGLQRLHYLQARDRGMAVVGLARKSVDRGERALPGGRQLRAQAVIWWCFGFTKHTHTHRPLFELTRGAASISSPTFALASVMRVSTSGGQLACRTVEFSASTHGRMV